MFHLTLESDKTQILRRKATWDLIFTTFGKERIWEDDTRLLEKKAMSHIIKMKTEQE